jgi:hypothetical protein
LDPEVCLHDAQQTTGSPAKVKAILERIPATTEYCTLDRATRKSGRTKQLAIRLMQAAQWYGDTYSGVFQHGPR